MGSTWSGRKRRSVKQEAGNSTFGGSLSPSSLSKVNLSAGSWLRTRREPLGPAAHHCKYAAGQAEGRGVVGGDLL